MNPIEAALRGVDRYQQRHALVGVPFAVVRKFGDDQGGNLATLLAWSAFFALFPLLLVLVTLLGYLSAATPPCTSGSCTLPWPSSRSSAPSSHRTSTRCQPTGSAWWSGSPGPSGVPAA